MSHEPVIPQAVRELFLRAVAHHQAGRAEDAERDYRDLLRRCPDVPGALANLADLLHARGRNAEAYPLFARALALDPADGLARNNHGRALLADERVDEAEAEFRAALKGDPDDARALNNLGELLLRRSAFEEAHALLARAVRLAPDSAAAHTTFGKLLVLGGRNEEALVVLRRAVALAPNSAEARSVLAGALWGEGFVEEAMRQRREALRLKPALFETWSLLLFTMHCGAGHDPAELFAEHLRFGRALERSVAAERQAVVADETPGRRLRVAYLSSDLRRHPVGLFLAPVLEAHGRDRFEVFAYSNVPSTDDVQARLRAAVEHWVDASTLNDRALAERLRADRIDVLVDLTGHTSNGRMGVFARRAAPVQLAWLGYPDTTGLAQMDYRVTDAVADPPGLSDERHTEELLRLPGGFMAWAPAAGAAAPEPPCVANGFVTFGSFNNVSKLSQPLARCWAAILREVPGSRMLLKHLAFAQAATRDRVRGWFEAEGVASERLTFLGFSNEWKDAYGALARVDVALDSFPYNGATTTCETLSYGVPLVALRGAAHAGRVSASMLDALGEPSLIAETPADYVRIAVGLARDPQRLAALRAALPQRWKESPVGSPARLARELEEAYRAAWERTVARAPRKEVPALDEATLPAGEYDLLPCGGAKVAVPPSLESLTAYVLREQGDWFEDELAFARDLTSPGDRVLDVGAAYGAYALPLAQVTGPAGRVWAVEPAARTAAFLRAGVARNDFDHVTVVQSALSDHTGEATLYMGAHGELASLTGDPAEHTASERVSLLTLDGARDRLGLRRLDLVKIDAQGEELRVVRGGAHLFADESPLVLAAIGPDADALRGEFAALGYERYRLVPGLGVLAPAPAGAAFDRFALNAFFCKPGREADLAARGLLVTPAAVAAAPAATDRPGRWRADLATLPYAQQMSPLWTARHPGRDALEAALDRWCDAHDPALDAPARVRALDGALDLLSAALDRHATVPRLVSVARVAWALGLRATAVDALQTAVEWFTDGRGLALDEPFLAPCPRFDRVRVPANVTTWCFAAVLEQFERLHAMSSYYDGRGSRPFLASLAQLGFVGEDMARRRDLVDERYGREG